MSINEIISAYIQEKENENAAKKRAAEMKKMILAHAAGRDCFTTDDFTVVVKKSVSIRLDTETLYKDFPDIKKEYGKESVSETITAVCTAGQARKSA